MVQGLVLGDVAFIKLHTHWPLCCGDGPICTSRTTRSKFQIGWISLLLSSTFPQLFQFLLPTSFQFLCPEALPLLLFTRTLCWTVMHRRVCHELKTRNRLRTTCSMPTLQMVVFSKTSGPMGRAEVWRVEGKEQDESKTSKTAR